MVEERDGMKERKEKNKRERESYGGLALGKLSLLGCGEAGLANEGAAIIYFCYSAFFYIQINNLIYQLLVRFNASF